jgi:hypothetical protein
VTHLVPENGSICNSGSPRKRFHIFIKPVNRTKSILKPACAVWTTGKLYEYIWLDEYSKICSKMWKGATFYWRLMLQKCEKCHHLQSLMLQNLDAFVYATENLFTSIQSKHPCKYMYIHVYIRMRSIKNTKYETEKMLCYVKDETCIKYFT